MQETAVGLFGNTGVADTVVDSLRAHGIPSRAIRVRTAPNGMAANGFGSEFRREMKAMGIADHEAEAYLDGLERGHVLIQVTGSRQQAAETLKIMNEFAALEIDAFANAAVSGTP